MVLSLALIVKSFGLVALAAAAARDLADRIIPNRIVGSVAAIGLAAQALTAPYSLWLPPLAAIVTLFAMGVLSHFAIIGGGDTKLIAATSLLVAPSEIPALIAAIAVAGGALSVTYLFARRALKCTAPLRAPANAGARRLIAKEAAKIAADEPMPYALAIFGGAAWLILNEVSPCFFATYC